LDWAHARLNVGSGDRAGPTKPGGDLDVSREWIWCCADAVGKATRWHRRSDNVPPAIGLTQINNGVCVASSAERNACGCADEEGVVVATGP
jgi:hypothetical protein